MKLLAKKNIGKALTYDITVPKTHTFCLKNGLVVHNSHTVPSGVSLMDLRISRYEDGVRLSFDYSQMEVRVLAKLSNDVELLKLFEDESADIHRMIASKVFRKDPIDITDTERKFAKTATFGILYGKSVFNFADEMMNGDIRAAQEIFDSLFVAFPGILRYIKESHLSALNTGKVSTMFGDEMYVGMPDIVFGLPIPTKMKILEDVYSDSLNFSSNDMENRKIKMNIGKALRNAQNWRIQSSASSIAGVCIYNINKFLKEKGTTSKVDCFTHDAGDIDLQLNNLPYTLMVLKREAIEEPRRKFGIPVNIDFAIGVSGNHMLDLSDCNVSEDQKTITTEFYGKKKGFDMLLEKISKTNIKIDYEIIKEETKKVSLKELFKPKGEYSLGESVFDVVEGKLTLTYK